MYYCHIHILYLKIQKSYYFYVCVNGNGPWNIWFPWQKIDMNRSFSHGINITMKPILTSNSAKSRLPRNNFTVIRSFCSPTQRKTVVYSCWDLMQQSQDFDFKQYKKICGTFPLFICYNYINAFVETLRVLMTTCIIIDIKYVNDCFFCLVDLAFGLIFVW